MSVATRRIFSMKRPSDLLAEHAAAFAQRVAELAWAGDSASLSEVASGSSDADVLALVGEIGNLVNLADAVAADVAGVVAARSVRGGEEPLANGVGEKSAAAAVAATAGVPVGRAGDWCRVGQALAPRLTLTGDPLPALHPAVAAAFDAGQLSLEAARLVLDTLTTLSPRLGLDELQARERFLVEEA